MILENEAYRVFLHDSQVKLSDNLNRIKLLQLFTISDYSVDIAGNQWFLYKPKYNDCLSTTTTDIDASVVKARNNKVTDEIMAGEIWLRLNNMPFAYPLSYNTKCTIKKTLWNNMLSSDKIKKCIIFQNFGCICYTAGSSDYCLFFLIEEAYSKDIYYFDSQTIGTNKRILVTPLQTIKFNSTDKLIDIKAYNGKYYVLYYDQYLFDSNSIKLKLVDSSDTGMITYITNPIVINLPKYDINGRNICSPNTTLNWTVSLSSDSLNVAYECIVL